MTELKLIDKAINIVKVIGDMQAFYPDMCNNAIVRRLIDLSTEWNDMFNSATREAN